MKYRVLRDFGVDVASVHYAHDASIDSEKAVPPTPAEVSEENRASYEEGLKRQTQTDIDAAVKDGFLSVDDRQESSVRTSAKTSKATNDKEAR